jgi:hypothetical protein
MHTEFSTLTRCLPLRSLLLLLIGVGSTYVFPNTGLAETWVCSRAGQSDLYTDREYPGCRQLGEAKTYSPLQISPSSRPTHPMVIRPPVSGTVTPHSPSPPHSRKPLPFAEVSMPLPVLGVTQAKTGFITGAWAGLVAQLIVAYKADGKGPEVIPDSNMMPVSVHSLWTAVAAASKAVGYDPRYLSVRLLVPMPMDGPSAGGIFAVGIAAALLGDSIRQDVCMSGTIEPDLEIRPVGGLVDKMGACRDLRKTTMIVPDGLDNSHLSFTGAERSIQVIQVYSLSEAYSAVTGQALRPVP